MGMGTSEVGMSHYFVDLERTVAVVALHCSWNPGFWFCLIHTNTSEGGKSSKP